MTLRIRLYLTLLSIFIGVQVLAQQVDTITTAKKFFEVKSFDKKKTKRIKQGEFYEVYLNVGDNVNQDTTRTLGGDLIGIDDSVLTLDMTYEVLKIESENYSFKEAKSIVIPKRISIPRKTINYIEYEPKAALVGGVIVAVSLFTALVSPIAAYDRSKPYNFNSQRFKYIAGSAVLGTLIGITLNYTIGTRKYKIK